MDKILAFLVPILTFTAGYYGPIQLAKMQGKTKKEEVKMEGDSKAEELYVTHVEKQLDRYEKQMERMEVDYKKRLAEVEDRFNQRFDALKKEMERDREKERIYYVTEIEKRDDRIEELEAIIIVKDDIISTLKGERINGNNHE